MICDTINIVNHPFFKHLTIKLSAFTLLDKKTMNIVMLAYILIALLWNFICLND